MVGARVEQARLLRRWLPGLISLQQVDSNAIIEEPATRGDSDSLICLALAYKAPKGTAMPPGSRAGFDRLSSLAVSKVQLKDSDQSFMTAAASNPTPGRELWDA